MKKCFLGWVYYSMYEYKSLATAEKKIKKIRELQKPWKLVKEIEIE